MGYIIPTRVGYIFKCQCCGELFNYFPYSEDFAILNLNKENFMSFIYSCDSINPKNGGKIIKPTGIFKKWKKYKCLCINCDRDAKLNKII